MDVLNTLALSPSKERFDESEKEANRHSAVRNVVRILVRRIKGELGYVVVRWKLRALKASHHFVKAMRATLRDQLRVFMIRYHMQCSMDAVHR